MINIELYSKTMPEKKNSLPKRKFSPPKHKIEKYNCLKMCIFVKTLPKWRQIMIAHRLNQENNDYQEKTSIDNFFMKTFQSFLFRRGKKKFGRPVEESNFGG